MAYQHLALIYDQLMDHVDYEGWYRFVMELARRGGCPDGSLSVLDLACGTGSFTSLLEGDGHQVIGIDRSDDMLAVARQKVSERVLLLKQDMRSFRLHQPVQLILCLFDSLNYLIEKEDLKQAFRQISAALAPGGVLIFDLQSEHHLQQVLGEHTFVETDQDVSYIWENFYHSASRICRMDMTFFAREASGLYRRFEETHRERYYDPDEIQAAAAEAGLNILGTYAPLAFMPPQPEDERSFWLAVK